MQALHQLNLEKLAQIQDLDLFQMIMSSADDFPGMYKVSRLHQPFWDNNKYLKLIHLLEIQLSKKEIVQSKSLWLKANEELLDYTFIKSDRNLKRTNMNVKKNYPTRYEGWLDSLKSIQLLAVDNILNITEIQQDECYYFMGSLLQFKSDVVSFNGLHLKVSFSDAVQYIKSILDEKQFGTLFFRASIVGKLNFDSHDKAEVVFEKDLSQLFSLGFHPQSLVVGSGCFDKVINFAKPIAITNILDGL